MKISGSYLDRSSMGKWDDPLMYNSEIPNEWIYIMNVSLQPDRSHRFQNINEIKSFLNTPKIERKSVESDFILKILDGEEPGKEYQIKSSITNWQKVLIGRETEDSNNDITVKEIISKYISRAHATLEQHDTKVVY